MDTDYHTTNTSVSTYFCLLLPSATLYTSCIRVCLCAKLRGVQDARGRRAKFSQLASEQQASLERFPLCTRTMDDWNYCECGPSISQFSTAFIPLSFARRNWTNVPLYLFTYTLSYPMYYIACPFNERLSTSPWRRFLLSLESNVVDGHFPPFQPFTASALFSSISSQLYFAPFSLLAISSPPFFLFFATKFPFFLFCRRSIFQRFLCFSAKISFLFLPYQVFLLFRRRLYVFAYDIVMYNRHGRFQDNFYKDRNVHGILLSSLRFVRIQITRRDKENRKKRVYNLRFITCRRTDIISR